MKVEAFHEFYRTIELVHKKRPYDNACDDAEQLISLFDSTNEPEYKSILIPTPIIVEQLPVIANNNNDNENAAGKSPKEDENFEEILPSIKKTAVKGVVKSLKKRKTSRSNSQKTSQKKYKGKQPKTARNIKQIV